MVAEEKFPMSEQGYTTGKLLDGSECEILLDTSASKSFKSKSHYLAIYVVNHSFVTQIYFENTKNSSRQWTICNCTFYHPNNNRYMWL